MNSDFARVSKLGFGCMAPAATDTKDPTAIEIEHVKQMVDAYLAGRRNYFDTAFVYHNGASEKALGEALGRAPPARVLHHRHEMPRLGVSRREDGEVESAHVA